MFLYFCVHLYIAHKHNRNWMLNIKKVSAVSKSGRFVFFLPTELSRKLGTFKKLIVVVKILGIESPIGCICIIGIILLKNDRLTPTQSNSPMSTSVVMKVRNETQQEAQRKCGTESPRITESPDYKLYPFNLFSLIF